MLHVFENDHEKCLLNIEDNEINTQTYLAIPQLICLNAQSNTPI